MNDQLVIYALICVLTPLASFLFTTFFGKRLPRGGDWMALGAIGISLMAALAIFAHAISEYDPELGVTWFIPRECKLKKSKNGKNFYVVKVIDDNNEMTVIRCWGVDPERDIVHINRPYMARLNYNQQWGFSTFSMRKMFKLLA